MSRITSIRYAQSRRYLRFQYRQMYIDYVYIWATWRVSHQWQDLFTFREHLSSHPGFLVGSMLLIFLAFCVVLLCVFMFWVQCCHVRYDFHIQTMFDSSLPPVVCSRTHVLFTLYMCLFAYSGVQHILRSFLRLMYPMISLKWDKTPKISHVNLM